MYGGVNIQMSSNRVIGTRELLYESKGSGGRRSFTVCIFEPYELVEGSVDFPFSEGTAGCLVAFRGLDENEMVVYGADTIQALAIAVDALEKYLHRLSRKYDFYFATGEPYFDD